MVKQSFFGLPGQYGRCVTRANYQLPMNKELHYFHLQQDCYSFGQIMYKSTANFLE